jgi:hypothetical protein
VPEEYLLYKAMIGDKSDGVPGVEGIGPARARIVIEATEGKLIDVPRDERFAWFKRFAIGKWKGDEDAPKYIQNMITDEAFKTLSKALDVIDLADSFDYTRYGPAVDVLMTVKGNPDRAKMMKLCTRHQLGVGSEAIARITRVMRRILS